jgi:hypothetical protein
MNSCSRHFVFTFTYSSMSPGQRGVRILKFLDGFLNVVLSLLHIFFIIVELVIGKSHENLRGGGFKKLMLGNGIDGRSLAQRAAPRNTWAASCALGRAWRPTKATPGSSATASPRDASTLILRRAICCTNNVLFRRIFHVICKWIW